MLLERGADPSHIDPWGQSAVHHAALSGDLRVLQAVLDAGGDPTPEGLYGWTPLQCAQKKRKEDSGHAKAIEAAIVEWEAKRQAKYQTLALLVVLLIVSFFGVVFYCGRHSWFTWEQFLHPITKCDSAAPPLSRVDVWQAGFKRLVGIRTPRLY